MKTIQAKAKLSQNKKLSEQTSIATLLVKSKDSVERDLGEAMLRNMAKPGKG